MVNFEAVQKLLESQGKLDFKPFHFNAKQEYWAYKTTDNTFHICDNDLKEIEKSNLGLDKYGVVLFVLEREEDYLFLEEGESVSTIQEEQPNNSIINIWFINKYWNKGWIWELVKKDIPGYRKIGDNWVVLETQIIDITSNHNQKYWIPNEKIICYDSLNLSESDRLYCGTEFLHFDLFYSNGKYFIEDKDFSGERHYFENIIIWFTQNDCLFVDVLNKDGQFIVELYKHNVEIRESFYSTVRGDKCIGSQIIDIDNLNEIRYFASKDVFLLSTRSGWISADRYGNIYSIKSKSGVIVSFINNILKINISSWTNKENKYDFYDYKGQCLAKGIREKAKYSIITIPCYSTGFQDESKKGNMVSINGVLNTHNHLLVVSAKYTSLDLFEGSDFFYAIIGEEYTNKSGAKSVQYGLLYNNDIVLPCNKEEIKSLSENLFVWKCEQKYGLVSNGKICCESTYDNVFLGYSIGRSKKHLYAILQKDDKYGLFVPEWDFVIPPTYTNLQVFVEEFYLLADGHLYNIQDQVLSIEEDIDITDYDYVGGLGYYHLFRKKGSVKKDMGNYICYFLRKNDCQEEVIFNAEEDDDIEEDVSKYIQWECYRPVFSLGDGGYYSVVKNEFYDNIEALASYPSGYQEDDYDYERDTYYALGGDDYDRWKENGGDLDVMMEGMGL